jgi:aminobenzoyl-glutamate utilization protein B
MTLLKGLWERVVATSEGAALGTGTRVEHEVIHGNFNVLPNETLSHVMDNSLQAVGGVLYSAAERAFADSLRTTFGDIDLRLAAAAEVQP